MLRIFNLLCLFFYFLSSGRAQPLYSWQEHLPWNRVMTLTAIQDKIFAATPFAVFSVSGDGTLQRFSRINGLNASSIQTIHSTRSGSLVIAYQDSNIDILNGEEIYNVNDLQQIQVAGDKRIYHISSNGGECLLSTGFGILVLNLSKYEIGDTWITGNNGTFSKINATAADADYFYAASSEGLKRCPRLGVNQADFRNWEQLGGTRGLPAGPVDNIVSSGNRLYVIAGSTIYRFQNDTFIEIYQDDWSWISIRPHENSLLIVQVREGQYRLVFLDTDGNILQLFSNSTFKDPRDAIGIGSTLWIADAASGLIEMEEETVRQVHPDAPPGIVTGDVYARNGNWWVGTENGLGHYLQGSWMNNGDAQLLPENFDSVGPIVQDGMGQIWAGSSSAGLLMIHEGKSTQFKAPLLAPSLDGSGYKVNGLAFDNQGILWISNEGSASPLVARYPGADSYRFSVPFLESNGKVSKIMVDGAGQKWMILPGKGIACFNQGLLLENPGDDQWALFQAGAGKGNLPSDNVLSFAYDQFGFLWVGTDNGIGIIQCPESVFAGNSCEAILPVVQSDAFPGYLFKGETVQAMAVDGANRKWIGTKNGAWLITADGEQTILRFTTGNSPLLDNDIRNIAIDHVSGTVFFATSKGLCTYRGDATITSNETGTIRVYPNPVPPGFRGNIAVRGLPDNSLVKITELNGRLVYQGRSLGGQLIWNGHDLHGRAVSTGVYLVLANNNSRQEQVVTKIIFIQH